MVSRASVKRTFIAASLLCVHCAGRSSGTDTLFSGDGDGGSGGASGHPVQDAGEGLLDSPAAPDDVADSGGAQQTVASGDSGSQLGSGSGDGGMAAPGNCATRTGMRGKTTRSLTVSGGKRTYVAYLPQSASPTSALPLVYVFHGASQTGAELFDMTQYSALADSEGIAVAFADGQGASSVTSTGVLAPWNVSDNGAAVCGAGAFANNPTSAVDFAFMDAIKADLTQDQCLDTKHVFSTGFSMGGYFTHHVACDRTDIRAAAPHSGGTVASLSSCATGHMPIIIFHGTADSLIADGCDDPNGTAQSGFSPSATLWAQKNGCQTTYTTMTVDGSGGGAGQCYLYNGCPSDGQVELCTFTNMSHAWAGAATCTNCIGSGAAYASATQLEWSFFKKYAW